MVRRTRLVIGSTVALAVILAFAPTSPAGAREETLTGPTGTVVMVHGLEDIPADVYLDGARSPALRQFQFRRVTDPLSLPVGPHRADIRRAGDPATATPILSGTIDVVEGELLTVTALLDTNGRPAWLAFPDDDQRTSTGSELRFRHLAASGPVTIDIDGERVATSITNLVAGGQVAPIPLDPGDHTISVQSAQGASLVDEESFVVPAEGLVDVYLTGREQNDSFDLLQVDSTPARSALQASAVQVLPAVIRSGNSGLLAARPAGAERGSAAALPLAFAAAAVGGALLRRRARRVGRAR